MTPDDVRAMYDRMQQLQALRDGAMSDSDAAAHQLARYVSDTGHRDLANLGTDWPYLRTLVRLYEQSWTDYLSAAKDWHESVDAYNLAHAGLASDLAKRG